MNLIETNSCTEFGLLTILGWYTAPMLIVTGRRVTFINQEIWAGMLFDLLDET